MDRHQLVAWYRRSCTDPQLKDLKRLVLLVKGNRFENLVEMFGMSVTCLSFYQWLVCLPSRFLSQQFFMRCFFCEAQWIMSFNQWLVFSQRPKENTPKILKKWLHFQVGEPVFVGSPWVWRQRCKPCKKHFRKANERWAGWPVDPGYLHLFTVCSM